MIANSSNLDERSFPNLDAKLWTHLYYRSSMESQIFSKTQTLTQIFFWFKQIF